MLVRQPLRKDGCPVQLNRDQQTAVALALLQDFTIVSGGPGTGKTSIVVTLLRCLVRGGISPERIGLAAPTGRAAQRLTEALRAGLDSLKNPDAADRSLTGLTADTLHRLLRYHPRRGTFLHHVENPLAADVVIVDEVSMVGISLLAQLFQALGPQTKLVLLGDKDQLASVEAGAVLASLVPSASKTSLSAAMCRWLSRLLPGKGVRNLLPERPEGCCAQKVPDPFSGTGPARLQDVLVVLEENYRSQRDIQEVARAINAQEVAIVERLPRVTWSPPQPLSFAELEQQGGCRLLDPETNVAKWREVLDHWARHHYLQRRTGLEAFGALVNRLEISNSDITAEQKPVLDQLLVGLQRARILTLIREGPWGCVGINRYLEQQLRPRLDPASRLGLFAGAPVLILRNDHGRQLYNGDVGLTLKSGGGYRVCFQRLGSYVSFPADALPLHELAFAQTVHKSQGSEYDQVLLVLPPEAGQRLLTKELIYTAITRARRLAIICGPPQALRLALARKIERAAALLNALAQDAG